MHCYLRQYILLLNIVLSKLLSLKNFSHTGTYCLCCLSIICFAGSRPKLANPSVERRRHRWEDTVCQSSIRPCLSWPRGSIDCSVICAAGRATYVRAEPKKAPATPASALLLFNFKIGVKHAILYDEIRQNQFNAPHFCPFTDLY